MRVGAEGAGAGAGDGAGEGFQIVVEELDGVDVVLGAGVELFLDGVGLALAEGDGGYGWVAGHVVLFDLFFCVVLFVVYEVWGVVCRRSGVDFIYVY